MPRRKNEEVDKIKVEEIPVICRIWTDLPTVKRDTDPKEDWYHHGILLFPTWPAFVRAGDGCQSWERVGQHGGANIEVVMSRTRRCNTKEAQQLMDLYHATYACIGDQPFKLRRVGGATKRHAEIRAKGG